MLKSRSPLGYEGLTLPCVAMNSGHRRPELCCTEACPALSLTVMARLRNLEKLSVGMSCISQYCSTLVTSAGIDSFADSGVGHAWTVASSERLQVVQVDTGRVPRYAHSRCGWVGSYTWRDHSSAVAAGSAVEKEWSMQKGFAVEWDCYERKNACLVKITKIYAGVVAFDVLEYFREGTSSFEAAAQMT